MGDSVCVTSPYIALLDLKPNQELVTASIVNSVNSCCYNRYKKPFLPSWNENQPGRGIKLAKSLVFNALVDFTAAPKSWLGVIQFDQVVFGEVSACKNLSFKDNRCASDQAS